ncbi:hypothetical protein PkoCFBP13504_00705 [Pseudomonas koreensis]|nr:hypothetical protein PkoCFBP13504_00705 [Pseudomonas koreensis]
MGLRFLPRNDVECQAAFASRLAPTVEMHSPVGASLLAKRPEQSIQIQVDRPKQSPHRNKRLDALLTPP